MRIIDNKQPVADVKLDSRAREFMQTPNLSKVADIAATDVLDLMKELADNNDDIIWHCGANHLRLKKTETRKVMSVCSAVKVRTFGYNIDDPSLDALEQDDNMRSRMSALQALWYGDYYKAQCFMRESDHSCGHHRAYSALCLLREKTEMYYTNWADLHTAAFRMKDIIVPTMMRCEGLI